MVCGVYINWRDTAPKEGNQLLQEPILLRHPTLAIQAISWTSPRLLPAWSLLAPHRLYCYSPVIFLTTYISVSTTPLPPNPQLWVLSLDAVAEWPSCLGTAQIQIVLVAGQPHAHP